MAKDMGKLSLSCFLNLQSLISNIVDECAQKQAAIASITSNNKVISSDIVERKLTLKIAETQVETALSTNENILEDLKSQLAHSKCAVELTNSDTRLVNTCLKQKIGFLKETINSLNLRRFEAENSYNSFSASLASAQISYNKEIQEFRDKIKTATEDVLNLEESFSKTASLNHGVITTNYFLHSQINDVTEQLSNSIELIDQISPENGLQRTIDLFSQDIQKLNNEFLRETSNFQNELDVQNQVLDSLNQEKNNILKRISRDSLENSKLSANFRDVYLFANVIDQSLAQLEDATNNLESYIKKSIGEIQDLNNQIDDFDKANPIEHKLKTVNSEIQELFNNEVVTFEILESEKLVEKDLLNEFHIKSEMCAKISKDVDALVACLTVLENSNNCLESEIEEFNSTLSIQKPCLQKMEVNSLRTRFENLLKEKQYLNAILFNSSDDSKCGNSRKRHSSLQEFGIVSAKRRPSTP